MKNSNNYIGRRKGGDYINDQNHQLLWKLGSQYLEM